MANVILYTYTLHNQNAYLTGSGEKVVAIFMKRDGHNSVGQVEGFLNTVSVMDVYVDV